MYRKSDLRMVCVMETPIHDRLRAITPLYRLSFTGSQTHLAWESNYSQLQTCPSILTNTDGCLCVQEKAAGWALWSRCGGTGRCPQRQTVKCKPAVYKPQFTGLEVMKISDPVCFVCWYGSDLHGCDGPSSNVEFSLSIHCEVSLDYNFQVTKTDTTLKVILTELLLTF